MPDTVPAGFRRSVETGLIVPETLSRQREVWSKDEWKTLERATKLLESRGVALYLGCPVSACKGAPLERIRRPDGGITLRCEHLDREFTAL